MGLFVEGGGGRGEQGFIIGGSFALQKWFGLHLEGILHLNMWVQGIELPCKCMHYVYIPPRSM